MLVRALLPVGVSALAGTLLCSESVLPICKNSAALESGPYLRDF